MKEDKSGKNREEEQDGKTDKPYDKSHKDFFSRKKNFLDFGIKYLRQDWMKELAEEDVELVDKEFIRENFETYESDVIYKITPPKELQKEGEKQSGEIYVFLIQEMQSNNDYTMPFRLLTYMFCLWMREFRNRKNPNVQDFRLPAILPCVFYNGADEWKAKREFADIVEYGELLGEYGLNFRYVLADAKREDRRRILAGNTLADNLMYLDSVATKEDCLEWIENMAQRILGLTDTEKHEIEKWIFLIIGQRFGNEMADKMIESLEKGDARDMSTGLEQVLDLEYEKGRLEGRLEGKQEGMEKGIEKGMEKGREVERTEMVQNMLLANLTISFIVQISHEPEAKIIAIRNRMIQEGILKDTENQDNI